MRGAGSILLAAMFLMVESWGEVAARTWIRISAGELVGRSDLIVVGRVGPGRDWRIGSSQYKLAAIEVDSVLWGEVAGRREVPVRWRVWDGYGADLDVDTYSGRPVIWFLKRTDAAYWTGAHPNCALALDSPPSMRGFLGALSADSLQSKAESIVKRYLASLPGSQPAEADE